MPIPTRYFETERLSFRPFEVGDLDGLAAIASDPEVVRHVGDRVPLPRDVVELWISRSRENVEKHGYGTGAITLRMSGELIGWGGVARTEDGQEELIYGFARQFWGDGLGTEFATALVHYLFETWGKKEVRATYYVDNVASAHILSKLGFERRVRPEAEDTVSHLVVLKQRPSCR